MKYFILILAIFLVACTPKVFDPHSEFRIEPVQCRGNIWEEWYYESHEEVIPMDEMILLYYVEERGAEIHTIEVINKHEPTCLACSCPTGEEIIITTTSPIPFIDDGWKLIEK